MGERVRATEEAPLGDPLADVFGDLDSCDVLPFDRSPGEPFDRFPPQVEQLRVDKVVRSQQLAARAQRRELLEDGSDHRLCCTDLLVSVELVEEEGLSEHQLVQSPPS